MADRTALHLLMTQRLLDEDPQRAYAHASVVRRLAGRLALSREALGLAAYRSARWAEAAAELRAVRRMTGSVDFLPLVADCERGLGRPERALAALDDPGMPKLDEAGRVELHIVAAGARRDLEQPAAAAASLQRLDPAASGRPWTARLRYAYADALLAAGRVEEALSWFRRAAEVDGEGATDAAVRVAELEGTELPEDSVVWDLEAEDRLPDGDVESEPVDGAEVGDAGGGAQLPRGADG